MVDYVGVEMSKLLKGEKSNKTYTKSEMAAMNKSNGLNKDGSINRSSSMNRN